MYILYVDHLASNRIEVDGRKKEKGTNQSRPTRQGEKGSNEAKEEKRRQRIYILVYIMYIMYRSRDDWTMLVEKETEKGASNESRSRRKKKVIHGDSRRATRR